MNFLPRFLRRRATATRRPEPPESGFGGLTPSMFAPLAVPPAPGRNQPLSALGRQWLESLPRRMRPLQLAERHPRLVNQLALCWHDHRLAERVLASLIVDQRGGRQGFAPPVLAELMVLREYHGDWSEDEVDPIWADSTLATVDR